jgi:hypothetical protein
MPKYHGIIFIISARFFSEYWSALRVPRTNAMTSVGLVLIFSSTGQHLNHSADSAAQ